MSRCAATLLSAYAEGRQCSRNAVKNGRCVIHQPGFYDNIRRLPVGKHIHPHDVDGLIAALDKHGYEVIPK